MGNWDKLSGCVLFAALVLAVSVCEGQTRDSANVPSLRTEVFGQMPDGTDVRLFTMSGRGLEVSVMEYGATLVSVRTPDREGKIENVVLGLDTFEAYLAGHPVLGSTIGRFANRIAGAKFEIDGEEHTLTPNSRGDHIHGGKIGYAKRLWIGAPDMNNRGPGVKFSLTSADGDEGYPGKVEVSATFRLTRDALVIEYEAQTDRPTHVNLTNHAYWNLAGAGSGDVLDHVLTLNADRYLPVNERTIPTGELRSVEGGPMDFRKPTAIGARIGAVEKANYDHCYVLNGTGPGPSFAARVHEPKSGRVMEVWTTQPGVQVYTAKGLSSKFGSGGKPYGPYHGLCLETQHFPNTPNESGFPSTLLRPGETYSQTVIHKFSVSPVKGHGVNGTDAAPSL